MSALQAWTMIGSGLVTLCMAVIAWAHQRRVR